MTGIVIVLFFSLTVIVMLCGIVLFCKGADPDSDWQNEIDDDYMDDLDNEYRRELEDVRNERKKG